MNLEIGPHYSSGGKRHDNHLEYVTDSSATDGSPALRYRGHHAAPGGTDYDDVYYDSEGDYDRRQLNEARARQQGNTSGKGRFHRKTVGSESRSYGGNGRLTSDDELYHPGGGDYRRDIIHRTRVTERSVDPVRREVLHEPFIYENGEQDDGTDHRLRSKETFEERKRMHTTAATNGNQMQSSRFDDRSLPQQQKKVTKTTKQTKIVTQNDANSSDWRPADIQVTSSSGEKRHFSGAVSRDKTVDEGSTIERKIRSDGRQHYRIKDIDYFIEPTGKSRQASLERARHAQTVYHRRPTRKRGVEKKTAEFFEDVFEDTFGLLGGRNRRKSKSMQNLSTADYSTSSKQLSVSRPNQSSTSRYQSSSSEKIINNGRTFEQGIPDRSYEQRYVSESQSLNRLPNSGRRHDVTSQSDRYLNIRRDDSQHRRRLAGSRDQSASRDRLHIIRPISRSGQYTQRALFSPPVSPQTRIRNAYMNTRSFSVDEGLNRPVSRVEFKNVSATRPAAEPERNERYFSSLKIERPMKEKVYRHHEVRDRVPADSNLQTISKGMVTRVVHELPHSNLRNYRHGQSSINETQSLSMPRSHFQADPVSVVVEPFDVHGIATHSSMPQTATIQYQTPHQTNTQSIRSAVTTASYWRNANSAERDDSGTSAFGNHPMLTVDVTDGKTRGSRATSAVELSEMRPDVNMKRDQVLNFYIFGQSKPVEEPVRVERSSRAIEVRTVNEVQGRDSLEEQQLREYMIYHKQTQTPGEQPEPQRVEKSVRISKNTATQAKPAKQEWRRAPTPAATSEVYQSNFFLKPQISETRSYAMESNAPTPSSKGDMPVFPVAQKPTVPAFKSNYSPRPMMNLQKPQLLEENVEEEEDDDEEVILETTSIEEKEQRIRMEIREDVEFSMLRTQGGGMESIASEEEGGLRRSVEPWWIPDKFEAIVDRRKQKTTKVENMESDGDFSMRREPMSASSGLSSADIMGSALRQGEHGKMNDDTRRGKNVDSSRGFRFDTGPPQTTRNQFGSVNSDGDAGGYVVEQAIKTKATLPPPGWIHQQSHGSTGLRGMTNREPEVVAETDVMVKPFFIENQQVSLKVEDVDQPQQQQRYQYNLKDHQLNHVTGTDSAGSSLGYGTMITPF